MNRSGLKSLLIFILGIGLLLSCGGKIKIIEEEDIKKVYLNDLKNYDPEELGQKIVSNSKLENGYIGRIRDEDVYDQVKILFKSYCESINGKSVFYECRLQYACKDVRDNKESFYDKKDDIWNIYISDKLCKYKCRFIERESYDYLKTDSLKEQVIKQLKDYIEDKEIPFGYYYIIEANKLNDKTFKKDIYKNLFKEVSKKISFKSVVIPRSELTGSSYSIPKNDFMICLSSQKSFVLQINNLRIKYGKEKYLLYDLFIESNKNIKKVVNEFDYLNEEMRMLLKFLSNIINKENKIFVNKLIYPESYETIFKLVILKKDKKSIFDSDEFFDLEIFYDNKSNEFFILKMNEIGPLIKNSKKYLVYFRVNDDGKIIFSMKNDSNRVGNKIAINPNMDGYIRMPIKIPGLNFSNLDGSILYFNGIPFFISYISLYDLRRELEDKNLHLILFNYRYIYFMRSYN